MHRPGHTTTTDARAARAFRLATAERHRHAQARTFRMNFGGVFFARSLGRAQAASEALGR